MSSWNEYVKQNYHLVKHLKNKDRLKALSLMRKRGIQGGVLEDTFNTLKGYTGTAQKITSGIDDAVQKVANVTSTAKNVANLANNLLDSGQDFVNKAYDKASDFATNLRDEAGLALGEMLL